MNNNIRCSKEAVFLLGILKKEEDMAYEKMNFTPGETLTATNMNKLAGNDASFRDGTGIADGAIKARHFEKSKNMGEALQEIGALAIGQWKEFAIGFGLNIKVLKIGRIVYWQTLNIANCGRSDRLSERIPEEFIPAVETILTTVGINSGPEYGTGVYRFRPDGSIGRWGATGYNEWLGSGCYIAKE